MRFSRSFPLVLFLFLMLFSCRTPEKKDSVLLPGFQADSSILLPNHYRLTPAGRQIPVGDLPLNMVISPGGRYLAVTNNGYSEQFVSILDLQEGRQVQTLPVTASFFGLAFNGGGTRLYVSGGGHNKIYIFTNDGKRFVQRDSIQLFPYPGPECFLTGLAVTPDGETLYAASKTMCTLFRISVPEKRILDTIRFKHFLYDVVLTPDGRKVYVSIWGGSSVGVVDALTMRLLGRLPAGDHPNKMVLGDDGRLFVANANTDNVTVLDTRTDEVTETIPLAPYEGAPYGSTPNGLALAPDGSTLFVAHAGNNDVAVVDVSTPGKARLRGLIPAGWYPTAVAVTPDGRTLCIANGKGIISRPNPGAPQPTDRHPKKGEYIGRLLWGTVSLLPVPGEEQLKRYTAQVRKNNRWDRPVQTEHHHAIPAPGGTSPIKHVVYIIKENRTYDQIFGDMPRGNGDTSLVLFGREVTPNHHKLAETFVLFDNFYVDAEVSADGHEWSTAAVATDFVEKMWPSVYSHRGKGYPAEGSFPIAAPTTGYLWDMAARHGLSYRSYAEFIKIGYNEKGEYYYTTMERLKDHFDPRFRPWDLDYPDTLRAAEFIRELKAFEQRGEWPNLMIMRLPNDHTYGTKAGKRTPRSMVADNDLALGMVVEAISHSRYWPETAIFVLEDDAQNGPDHVDAHRSILLVASPYARRGWVDHNMYSTVSVLRTIELILGMEPMSQFDAAAFPLTTAFTDRPDLTPYTMERNTWPTDRINSENAYGAEASARMDWDEEDETPEQPLNEILWKAVKGADSPMPPIRNMRYTQLFGKQL